MSFLINPYVYAGFDPDAQAFITAAGITNTTQQQAINTLVLDLKGYGIWSKMKAIYPFVGGTASTHKWNLKDPRDLDAAFRLVFSGGWTHSVNGALPSLNGYSNSFLNANTILTNGNFHLSFYSRTNSTVNNYSADILMTGSYAASGWVSLRVNDKTLGIAYASFGNDNTEAAGASSTTSGYMVATETSNSLRKIFKNNLFLAQNTTTSSTALKSENITFAGSNFTGSNSSLNQCAFASIGDGLTDTEASNLYTAVQAYQTTLGRSIGTQTVSDPDAQAFVTAANIQDQVQADAVNNLTIGLKADGLWSKMKAIYPFVGGSNSQHSWNLRNTTQYQITWIGGVTSSNLGVKFNGINSYGNTGLNFSTVLSSANSNSLGYYSGTNLSEIEPDTTPMGAADNFSNFAVIGKSNTVFVSRLNSSIISFSTATMKGFFSASRQSSTLTDIYLNGSQVATGNSGGSLPNFVCYLGNINIANIPYGDGFMLNDMRFSYISDGLTDTEVSNLYSRVQTYQTALNRQV